MRRQNELVSQFAMPFLYLATKGWKAGKAHEIEIWHVEEQGAYYIVSELGARSH